VGFGRPAMGTRLLHLSQVGPIRRRTTVDPDPGPHSGAQMLDSCFFCPKITSRSAEVNGYWAPRMRPAQRDSSVHAACAIPPQHG